MTESPYSVLGVPLHAPRDEVKEAFRRLCMEFHPDKCQPQQRLSAEAKFKEIKAAYESILRGEAGYDAPPPGTAPSKRAARAYWRAHAPDGRVPWGKFAGYETEWAFYRSMFIRGQGNIVVLSTLGLLGIPMLAGLVWTVGTSSFWGRFQERGMDTFRETHIANGEEVHSNPFGARGPMESYVFKHTQYAHLRQTQLQRLQTIGDQPAAQHADAPAPATQ